jgi:hypothetical protein
VGSTTGVGLSIATLAPLQLALIPVLLRFSMQEASSGSTPSWIVTTLTDDTLFSTAGSPVVPADDTKPTATEGVSYISLVYTAAAIGNIIDVEASITAGSSAATHGAFWLSVDGADALSTSFALFGVVAGAFLSLSLPLTVRASIVAADLAPHTFDFRIGGSGGFTIFVNGNPDTGARLYGGSSKSIVTVTERPP